MEASLSIAPAKNTGIAAIADRYGLRAETVKYFGLHDALHPCVSTGAVIPIVFQGATVAKRFKHDPANAARCGVKAYWLGAGRFDLYNLDAVRSGERVSLAAGEPDTWVFQQADVVAVSFLKGEGCVPAEAVRLLAERGPSLVSITYDLDEAGRAGADKAYWALTDAGLAAEIVELPADVGHKGDVADLYRMLRHDDAALRATVAGLPRRAPAPRPPAGRPVGAGLASGSRPGDEWAAHTDWATVLEPHGWRLDSTRGEVERWTRPGKRGGASATVNYAGRGLLYVFTGNAAPFESGRGYGKFSAYSLLNFGGDYAAAARALAAQGYGEDNGRDGQTMRMRAGGRPVRPVRLPHHRPFTSVRSYEGRCER